MRPFGGCIRALVLGALLLPAPALAHGPTVRIAYSGVRPAQLAIAAGATVHFLNANTSGAECTIAADDGSFESPALARGEGWHHTFEKPGSYAFHVKELSGSKGLVIVGEP